jgi:hypothetical protein
MSVYSVYKDFQSLLMCYEYSKQSQQEDHQSPDSSAIIMDPAPIAKGAGSVMMVEESGD